MTPLAAEEAAPSTQSLAAKEVISLQQVPGSDKISLDLKGMDVVEVIKMLASKGNLNIALGNDVKGRVTIFLKSVSLMDAFEIILLANNLAYDRRGDIIYVMTQREYEAMYGERYADRKEMKIYQLRYAKAAEVNKTLGQMKSKLGKLVVDEGSNTVIAIDSPQIVSLMTDTIDRIDSPTVTKIFELKYAKAADMKTKISESITKNVGAVQVDERTNKVVVSDLARKMDEIEQMVTAFDDRLQQVLIESKILQITLDDKFKLGVDWQSVLKKLSKQVNIKSMFELAPMATGMNPGVQLVIGALNANDDYAMMVQALKEIGDTNLLSSPRITALNNQEAKILIGTSQPYATNTVTQGTSTSTTATNLTFIDVGVKLYVTPTINKEGFVTMKIKPEVSSKSSDYTYGSPETKVPVVETTQAETSVTIKDGTTIIIAGLIKDERSDTVDKIPLLGDIPIVGIMFRKTVKEIKKQEIVIFLTPHIINGESNYLVQPQGPPIGDQRFTVPEKPGYERRNKIDMKPDIFKEKKLSAFDEMAMEESSEEAPRKDKVEMTLVPKNVGEYYYSVKQKIVDSVVMPKGKKRAAKGNVRVAFFLSPKGEISSGPEVLKSANHALDNIAVKAVSKAAPFPEFPVSMGQEEKRFIIDLDFQ
jgi:type II secretory pathway component GspD/PulD (secretin)